MKAVLVADMPTTCRECNYCSYIINRFTDTIDFICYLENKILKCDIDKVVYQGCPLKPLKEILDNKEELV